MMSFPIGSMLKSRHARRGIRIFGVLALLFSSLSISLLVLRTPVAAAGDLSLLYANAATAASSNVPSPQFEIANSGTTPVALSDLTIRYWYTEDGTQAQQFYCNYALVGCSNVTGSFVTLTTPTASADTYVQLGFTSGAGSIATNGNTGAI